MTIRKGFIKEDYTRINNRIAQDTSISLEARGVWIDLCTRPDDWVILPKYMAKQCGIGRDKMYRLLNELIEAGVCQREQIRQRTSGGREVLGKMEYVIYNDYIEPTKESSVRPGFQDTEYQCPESQCTDHQYTTNKRLKESKEKEQRLDPSKKDYGELSSPPVKKVVVVPSLCLSLGACEESYSRLLKPFTEEEILAACEVAVSQGTKPDNFFGWIRDCIQGGWEATASSEQVEKKNRKIMRDRFHRLDGKTLGGESITVLNQHVEFLRGGASNCVECIRFDDKHFESRMMEKINKLNARERG